LTAGFRSLGDRKKKFFAAKQAATPGKSEINLIADVPTFTSPWRGEVDRRSRSGGGELSL